jgi:DNA-directed RNA polymerase specialized sigma24 family protein
VDDAASEFCDRIRDRLVGALTLTCGDRGVAEELAQETLVRVWERWPKVRAMDSPEGWAFRTGFNLAGSWGRRRRAERRAHHRSVVRVAEPVDDLAEIEAVRSAVSALLDCAPGTVKAATHQALANLRTSGLVDDIPEEAETP